MARRIDTQAVIEAVRLEQQAGNPAAPAAGYWLVYFKAGGLYIEDSAGNVTGPLSAGGNVATDAIWDAAGDLVQGTGADTASRLAIGTYPQLLRVNSGATAVEWVSAGKVLISEQTPTGTGTVTWSSIPDIYNSLELEGIGRGTTVAATVNMSVYLNNDTTAGNYRSNMHLVYASTTHNVAIENSARIGELTAASGAAGLGGAIFFKLIDYTETTFHKAAFYQTNYRAQVGGGNELVSYNGSYQWESTNAVNRIDLVLAAGNFDTGSVFRLYGVF